MCFVPYSFCYRKLSSFLNREPTKETKWSIVHIVYIYIRFFSKYSVLESLIISRIIHRPSNLIYFLSYWAAMSSEGGSSKSATIEMYAPSSYNETVNGETLSSISEKSESYSQNGSHSDFAVSLSLKNLFCISGQTNHLYFSSFNRLRMRLKPPLAPTWLINQMAP